MLFLFFWFSLIWVVEWRIIFSFLIFPPNCSVLQDQKVYVNMQNSGHSNAYFSSTDQSRWAKDEEVYDNSIMFHLEKPNDFPDQSEDDVDNIYANSFAVDRLSTHCS